MDVINILLFTAVLFLCFYAYYRKRTSSYCETRMAKLFNKLSSYTPLLVVLLVAVGAGVRLFALDSLPVGFNQDEASMAYDSYCLAYYGIDRNGYAFPVYPVAWGAGHGPFFVYLAIPFIRIFGLSEFSYRLPMALLNIAAMPVFYLLIRRLFDKKTALVSLALFAVSPWNIVLSRWGLDANPLPAMVIFAAFALVKAVDNGKLSSFLIAGVLFSLSLYTYGASYVAVPILLLLVAIYLLRNKRLSFGQMTMFLSSAFVVAVPLILFYIVNFFHLPEIKTTFFSVPRLTALRSDSIFIKLNRDFFARMVDNVGGLLRLLFVQDRDHIWNTVPGFGTLYLFASPLTVLGLFELSKRMGKKDTRKSDFLMLAWLISAVVLALIIDQNVNRLSILYPPLIYLTARGIVWIFSRFKQGFVAVCLCFALGFSLFTVTYFGSYQKQLSPAFAERFGEAVRYADSLNKSTVYITERVNGSYILTLFYLQIPPEEFAATVQYYDDQAPFRMASSFSKYRFRLPGAFFEETSEDAVYVLSPSDTTAIDFSLFSCENFGDYRVIYRK